MSELQAAAGTSAESADASLPQSAPPGVLRSLAFWLCLLLAAGGYALATLAPSYVRNQQLKAESAAADAEFLRLMAQVERYERYCSQLTAESPVVGDAREEDRFPASPLPPQHVGSSRWAERGGEGGMSITPGEAVAPWQQIAVEESLQFQLEDVAVAGEPVSAPSVSAVIALFSRSQVARGAMRVLSALLLLLAFTLCLDAPQERPPAVRPRRAARRMRHPLAWLGMRYRSADSGGPG